MVWGCGKQLGSFGTSFTVGSPLWWDVWNVSKGWGSWSPRFIRPFNDWEVDEVERLLLWLGGKRVNLVEEDGVLWPPTKSAKNKLLCFGGLVGKSFNFGPNLEEGLGFSK
ncbi:hypothetical protein CK203_082651 [Vitis vinifera]|uniref:Uncharacterized protein n=1 Tax=Vitis vinifera TaxID=29760 RepID=A0A438BWN5_VITVI|nr:hypothetical protein CK203_082651 [Vitis vinifera]